MGPAMARSINRLSARAAATLSAPGRYADGAGLYLSIDADGRRRWIYLFTLAGKRREMGLGAAQITPLAAAREAAAQARLVAQRIDPIEQRDQAKRAARPAKTPSIRGGRAAVNFQQVAIVAQRRNRQLLAPAIRRSRHVAHVAAGKRDQDTDILAVLQPALAKSADIGGRLRRRIEAVLDAARAHGHRSGENRRAGAAIWTISCPGRRARRRRIMPRSTIATSATSSKSLRTRDTVASLAFEFMILTAARTGEARLATWDEIDIDARVWTVPASRMKAGRAHRVPLSDRALEILGRMQPLRRTDFVFPGRVEGQPLGPCAFRAITADLAVKATPHGFRSAFRDWAGDCTSSPTRDDRGGLGPCRRQRGRAGLSAQRRLGQAPRTDAGMGPALRSRAARGTSCPCSAALGIGPAKKGQAATSSARRNPTGPLGLQPGTTLLLPSSISTRWVGASLSSPNAHACDQPPRNPHLRLCSAQNPLCSAPPPPPPPLYIRWGGGQNSRWKVGPLPPAVNTGRTLPSPRFPHFFPPRKARWGRINPNSFAALQGATPTFPHLNPQGGGGLGAKRRRFAPWAKQ